MFAPEEMSIFKDVPPDPNLLARIDVYPASMWDCEICGTENFVRTVSHVFTKDQVEHVLRKAGHLQPYKEVPDEANMVGKMTPLLVQCGRCGAWFRTVKIEEHDGCEDEIE